MTGYFLWWPGDWPSAVICGFMESLLRFRLGLDPDCVSDADLALLGTRGIVSHGPFHPLLQPRVKCRNLYKYKFGLDGDLNLSDLWPSAVQGKTLNLNLGKDPQPKFSGPQAFLRMRWSCGPPCREMPMGGTAPSTLFREVFLHPELLQARVEQPLLSPCPGHGAQRRLPRL